MTHFVVLGHICFMPFSCGAKDSKLPIQFLTHLNLTFNKRPKGLALS
jgi:hypothetical protein